jgi:hypothetical protein
MITELEKTADFCNKTPCTMVDNDRRFGELMLSSGRVVKVYQIARLHTEEDSK